MLGVVTTTAALSALGALGAAAAVLTGRGAPQRAAVQAGRGAEREPRPALRALQQRKRLSLAHTRLNQV
jgi:hypothetical protein